MKNGQFISVQLLVPRANKQPINTGTDKFMAGANKGSLLHYAAIGPGSPILNTDYLIEKGLNTNYVNANDEIPLHSVLELE